MYNKVVKNNQITYGVPFQLKIPLNYHSIKVQDNNSFAAEESVVENEVDFSAEMISKARVEAELITQEAKYEAIRIIEEASREADARAEQIKKEAWENGYSDGVNSAQREYEALLQEAQSVKENAIEEHDHTIKCMEREIIEMTLEIARKVIGQEVEINQENMLSIVRQAIEKCSNRNNMVIKVSSEDYNYLNQNIDKLQSTVQGVDVIDLRMDLSLKPGDCIIDTPFGSVDAGVQTKLLKIEEAFRELMEDRIYDNEG